MYEDDDSSILYILLVYVILYRVRWFYVDKFFFFFLSMSGNTIFDNYYTLLLHNPKWKIKWIGFRFFFLMVIYQISYIIIHTGFGSYIGDNNLKYTLKYAKIKL